MRTSLVSASADYLDDSDAGRKLELIHSSSCEDDRKLCKNRGEHKLAHKSPSSSCKHRADVPNILTNVPKGGC